MFVPANSDHAVASVSFRVRFLNPFEKSEIEAIMDGHKAWKREFPAMRPANGLSFGPSSEGGAKVQETPGVEFAYLRPDGSPAWLMAVINNELILECNRYTRWDKIWSVAFRNMQAILSRINENPKEVGGRSHDILSFGLGFRDLFFWAARIEEYNLRLLLRSNPMVAESSFDNGSVWHSHAGWFESVGEERATLLTLNVTAAQDMEPARSRGFPAHVEILNEQERRFVNEGQSLQEAASSSFCELSEAMRLMHIRNKEILKALLVEEMEKDIGLSS